MSYCQLGNAKAPCGVGTAVLATAVLENVTRVQGLTAQTNASCVSDNRIKDEAVPV